MKNVLFALLIMTFILASCNSLEAVNVKSNPVTLSDSGYLVSKPPIEFDGKFGYKVTVLRTDTAKSYGYYEKVFMSKNLYDNIPKPQDNLKVKIYFLKEINYGKVRNGEIYWDTRFNVGYDYKVENK